MREHGLNRVEALSADVGPVGKERRRQHVRMRLDEPGQDGGAGSIDDGHVIGAGPCGAGDLIDRADRNDASVVNAKCVDGREVVIDGEDGCAPNDEGSSGGSIGTGGIVAEAVMAPSGGAGSAQCTESGAQQAGAAAPCHGLSTEGVGLGGRNFGR